jgi:phosphocarrier protein HPr
VKQVREIQIINKLGLHLRAAAQFVQVANQHSCDVWVLKDDARVNGKSIMGVMTLIAVQGSSLTMEVDGEGGDECLAALEALAANKFGESE